MNAHRDWRRGWLYKINYTLSLLRRERERERERGREKERETERQRQRHTESYTRVHRRGLKGNVRVKRAVMTLDFPECLP